MLVIRERLYAHPVLPSKRIFVYSCACGVIRVRKYFEPFHSVASNVRMLLELRVKGQLALHNYILGLYVLPQGTRTRTRTQSPSATGKLTTALQDHILTSVDISISYTNLLAEQSDTLTDVMTAVCTFPLPYFPLYGSDTAHT